MRFSIIASSVDKKGHHSRQEYARKRPKRARGNKYTHAFKSRKF